MFNQVAQYILSNTDAYMDVRIYYVYIACISGRVSIRDVIKVSVRLCAIRGSKFAVRCSNETREY